MINFTPGPWVVDEASFSKDGPDVVDWSVHAKGMVISAANARLIASAPELYAALDRLVLSVETASNYAQDQGFVTVFHDVMEQARAALAKAEGK